MRVSTFTLHKEALYEEISQAEERQQEHDLSLSPSEDSFISATSSSFLQLWENELHRLEHFLTAQQGNLEASANALLTDVEKALICGNSDDVSQIHTEANELKDACVELQRITIEQKKTLEKIARCHDSRRSNYNCMSNLQQRFQQTTCWKDVSSSWLVVLLSDITSELAEKMESTGEGKKNNGVKSGAGSSNGKDDEIVLADNDSSKPNNSSTGGLFSSTVTLFCQRNRSGHDSSDSDSVTAPLIAPKRPARVEPKSYFANERTFIQWVSAGLLLVTISVILLGIDSRMGSMAGYARKAGVGVCGGAAMIVLYATFVYYRRLRLLASGQPYGYVDHIGPFILAIAVATGVVILLINFVGEIEFSRQEAAAMVFLHEETGQCFLHGTRGISLLEYQPSDIAVDEKRNILLIPTLQRIVSHSLTAPLPNLENRVETLVEVPNSDLEAVTIIDDRVFALSEGPTKTELIELNWNDNEELVISSRWKLGPSQEAEGMTYIPDKSGRSGRLFIDVNHQIQIYNVPEPLASASSDDDDDESSFSLVLQSEEEISSDLDRIGSLNNHVLKNGLTEIKISGMYYFEGVAYILHDNEMILRAWDLDEGDLLAEMQLPRVGDGFSKEWEGVALERRAVSDNVNGLLKANPMLRGSNNNGDNTEGTEVILHLALDTPAQVWSMVVKEGAKRGELILPTCAVNSDQNRNFATNGDANP